MFDEDKQKEMQDRINELELTLEGVMWFVDKWLDGKELELDPVTRSAKMREKTLDIVENERRMALLEAVKGFECHSNYHGDAIVSRLVCMAEGKKSEELVKPLPLDYYYKKEYVDLCMERLEKKIEEHIIMNDGRVDWEWLDNLHNNWKI